MTKNKNNQAIWNTRIKKKSSSLFQKVGNSLDVDKRLYKEDIKGSIAHVEMLFKQKIISFKIKNKIIYGLTKIDKEITNNKFEFNKSYEDIHMNIDSALTERIGDAGAKLHTARSRNDQVSLDMRMYCKEEISHLVSEVKNLQSSLLDCCERFPDTVLPGYTHLQRGQPVLFAHHLLAYIEMFSRDANRLEDAIKRVDVMPLGSGALAGSTIPLDRDFIAETLGFSKISGSRFAAPYHSDIFSKGPIL